MKVINFGSLNIDKVYGVKEIVRGGETICSSSYHIFTGGKGLNQSTAVAKAGGRVVHAGAIGPDGGFLEAFLQEAGVDTASLLHTEEATGHAIILVNEKGQNAIIVHGGANQLLTKAYIDAILEKAEEGDYVLLQNETNLVSYIIGKAHAKGVKVVWNPSPFPERIEEYPREEVDLFMVNEIEGALLAGLDPNPDFEEILERLSLLFPSATIVMTLGDKGVLCMDKGEVYRHECYRVKAVDTTAAGDTFCGYFLAACCEGRSIPECLEWASAASAIAVSRPGAAPSIPSRCEVEAFLE